MLEYIKKLLIKNRLKRYSTTMTLATEGVNSKKNLSQEIKSLIKRIKSGNKISHEEVNTLLSFYFNKKEINPGIYTFNKNITNGMVFKIDSVNTILNKDNDVENVFITLVDIVYNIEFTITISGKEFYEVFKDFKPKQSPEKELSSAD